jgi:hypothetical protein
MLSAYTNQMHPDFTNIKTGPTTDSDAEQYILKRWKKGF